MKLRVGIVGYHTSGKAHYSELRRCDKYDICAVFDERGADDYCRANVFENFKDFIVEGRPNAIILTLPQDKIFEAYRECVKFCPNILLAPYLCKNAEELAQMSYLANKTGAKTALCFSSRFNPVITSLLRSLKRDDEIFSIDIFHSTNLKDGDIISELTLRDIDIAKVIANSATIDLSSSFTNRENSRSSDNAAIKIKFKNQIVATITNSLTSQLNRYIISVNTSSGLYFADMLSLKLHQINENGQMNHKVDADVSELRALYDEFYNYTQGGETSMLATLDDAIKIREFLK